ncbi:hypothetical protein BN7_2360 [Wickerhamomyces ciferrii]|uniref:Uncharacterized protein n=1 Tax=Wickerhamomyces ciferrii (strain ATCC 14091 / BCRC 22168 / CBS 111 / JCM 3599 / NBRC 0793 / NRRL Y-1031 F-60-10) TaxID=1206466 RepID=K0KIL2_WICCF|nr:uncharacterized protein BN7_2360 [Wickerhamomyces ciferrii]CCH42816.1 hypothetical protein BN7_2360 [Wickerhamomyces ciferrii]
MLMKLDLSLQQNIKIMNSLLGAYCSLQDFFKTNEIFDSIISNGELNNETVSIMIKLNTYISLGHVQQFWNGIYEFGLLPDEDNYKQFVVAHCYYERYDDALRVVEGMKDYDLEVRGDLIETLYKWTKNDEKRLVLERWARENYKGIWNELEPRLKIEGEVKQDKNEVNESNVFVTKEFIHEGY